MSPGGTAPGPALAHYHTAVNKLLADAGELT
jgi:hypothetical protein